MLAKGEQPPGGQALLAEGEQHVGGALLAEGEQPHVGQPARRQRAAPQGQACSSIASSPLGCKVCLLRASSPPEQGSLTEGEQPSLDAAPCLLMLGNPRAGPLLVWRGLF